jgi:hypothetical protein
MGRGRARRAGMWGRCGRMGSGCGSRSRLNRGCRARRRGCMAHARPTASAGGYSLATRCDPGECGLVHACGRNLGEASVGIGLANLRPGDISHRRRRGCHGLTGRSRSAGLRRRRRSRNAHLARTTVFQLGIFIGRTICRCTQGMFRDTRSAHLARTTISHLRIRSSWAIRGRSGSITFSGASRRTAWSGSTVAALTVSTVAIPPRSPLCPPPP